MPGGSAVEVGLSPRRCADVYGSGDARRGGGWTVMGFIQAHPVTVFSGLQLTVTMAGGRKEVAIRI